MKSAQSIEDYKAAALRLAQSEAIEGGKTYFAEIPGFDGVWAQGATAAAAKRELAKVLDGWIELRLEKGLRLPTVGRAKPPQLHFA
jgi:predicted RNase H-like HicB family nuclease